MCHHWLIEPFHCIANNPALYMALAAVWFKIRHAGLFGRRK